MHFQRETPKFVFKRRVGATKQAMINPIYQKTRHQVFGGREEYLSNMSPKTIQG